MSGSISCAPTDSCLGTAMHRVTQAELSSSDRVDSVPVGKPVPRWRCCRYDDETDAVLHALDESQFVPVVYLKVKRPPISSVFGTFWRLQLRPPVREQRKCSRVRAHCIFLKEVGATKF